MQSLLSVSFLTLAVSTPGDYRERSTCCPVLCNTVCTLYAVTPHVPIFLTFYIKYLLHQNTATISARPWAMLSVCQSVCLLVLFIVICDYA